MDATVFLFVQPNVRCFSTSSGVFFLLFFSDHVSILSLSLLFTVISKWIYVISSRREVNPQQL